MYVISVHALCLSSVYVCVWFLYVVVCLVLYVHVYVWHVCTIFNSVDGCYVVQMYGIDYICYVVGMHVPCLPLCV